MKLKKCKECNSLINVINKCNCKNNSIKCCDQDMVDLVPNSTDASFEKHIPEINISDNYIEVKVNHVMEDEHYIEFISYVGDDFEFIKYFKPGEEATIKLPYKKGSKVYSYCNKHGLWMKEVE